ncbi:hypothetical protein [Luteimonas salinilitoris]|uniref:Uncharacterized protein n=1 Tax=Luteimonas salinilitoris TaxID=3237697 RepID=A0ABV4HX72_9GAMM
MNGLADVSGHWPPSLVFPAKNKMDPGLTSHSAVESRRDDDAGLVDGAGLVGDAVSDGGAGRRDGTGVGRRAAVRGGLGIGQGPAA